MLKLLPFFAEFNMNDRNSVVGAGHGNLSTIDNRPSLLSPSQSGVPEAPDTFAIQTKVTPDTVTLPRQVTSDSVDLQPLVTLDLNPHQPQVTLNADPHQPQVTLDSDPLHYPASHKMNSPSPATVNTNSKKRLKAKSNFGICKSITNPFCSGGVRMENFTLWKSNKPKTTPTETTVNIVELEKVPRTTNRPKEKVRKGKRKRSCGIPGCVPCSVVTNCSVCNYCILWF